MEPTSVAGVLGALAAFAAVFGAWIGPGFAITVALGTGRDRLERVALAVAIGRVLFAAVSILACGLSAPKLLIVWALLGAAAGAFAWWRSRATLARTGTERAVAVAIGCAVLLVVAVVGRSALPQSDGVLTFFGRDSANDPFVYGSFALALRDGGLPLANPFAGGDPVPGSYVLFGVLAGLASASGAAMTDLVYRVLPLVDTIALGITSIAFVRALGAPRLAWSLAPLLLLLGGDPSAWLAALGRVFGFAVQRLDTWALFGPYLLSFNPIAAGMQTLFCAYFLLARGAATRRRDAILAGLLLGALVEIKLFLWAPAIGSLFAVALFWPPAGSQRVLRWAAAAAALVSLPSLVEKFAWARAAGGRDETGFGLCLGCFPHYVADAAWGSGDLSFAIFRAGSVLLAPGAIVACVTVAAIALGARALALGEVWRGARVAATAVVYRQLAIASVLGFALAFTLATPPHFLNAAQFAWIAIFGLWPLVAIAIARWQREGRWVLLAVAVLLTLPGSLDTLLRLGWGAPRTFSISRDERSLAVALRAASAPGDVVFEPSMLVSTDHPSAMPLLAGRPVYLSLLSAVLNLPVPERELRFARVATFFAGDDANAAARALHESRARFVFVPRGVQLRHDVLDGLDVVATNAAGTLYRANN